MKPNRRAHDRPLPRHHLGGACGNAYAHCTHYTQPTNSTEPNNLNPPTKINPQEEWALDYKYSYSTDPLAAKVFPNGHVHDGLFQMFKMVYADLEKVSLGCLCLSRGPSGFVVVWTYLSFDYHASRSIITTNITHQSQTGGAPREAEACPDRRALARRGAGMCFLMVVFGWHGHTHPPTDRPSLD